MSPLWARNSGELFIEVREGKFLGNGKVYDVI